MKVFGQTFRGGNGALALFALFLFAAGPAAAQEMRPPPDFQVTARSAYGFDETLARLRQAIEEENLMVVHEINPQQMLRMVGVRSGGMRQIMFFHPRYMKRIIESNRHAAIEPPLKLAVMETPDGGVMMRYIKPAYVFGRYGGLGELGSELEALVERIVASVKE